MSQSLLFNREFHKRKHNSSFSHDTLNILFFVIFIILGIENSTTKHLQLYHPILFMKGEQLFREISHYHYS